MSKVMEIFKPKMPEKEKPAALPIKDDIGSQQAAQRERAEASARSGEMSTRLTEQRLGEQGSPMLRTGSLAGSSIITA